MLNGSPILLPEGKQFTHKQTDPWPESLSVPNYHKDSQESCSMLVREKKTFKKKAENNNPVHCGSCWLQRQQNYRPLQLQPFFFFFCLAADLKSAVIAEAPFKTL